MNEVEKIWEIREVKWVFQHKNQIIAAIGIIQASRFFLKIVNYIIQYRRHKVILKSNNKSLIAKSA